MWSLRELAHQAELSLTDAKIAIERLVMHGQLIRQGGEHYRHPALEEGEAEVTAGAEALCGPCYERVLERAG